MTAKTWWAMVAACLGLAFLAWATMPREGVPERNLPWQVDAVNGSTKVFGIELGRTTLEEAQLALKSAATVSLFQSNGHLALEGYFDEVNLGGLKAKIVLALDLPEGELASMFERGIRMSGSPSGKKVTLSSEDTARAVKAPVNTITYLPAIKVKPDAIANKFGQPAERLIEDKSHTEHWLYPAIGLDVALGGEDGKPVLQYVAPSEFSRLEAPLRAAAHAVQAK